MEFFLKKNKLGATFVRNTRVRSRCWYDMRCWLRSEHKMLRGCAPDQVHNMLAHDNRWSQLLFWLGVFPYTSMRIFEVLLQTKTCACKLSPFAFSISSEQKQCALSNSSHLTNLNHRFGNWICFLDGLIQYVFPSFLFVK